MHCWFSSRSYLPNRLEHRLIELVHSSSLHPSVKGFTDVGTDQPELDVVRSVGHRVLVTCEPLEQTIGEEWKVYLDHR